MRKRRGNYSPVTLHVSLTREKTTVTNGLISFGRAIGYKVTYSSWQYFLWHTDL